MRFRALSVLTTLAFCACNGDGSDPNGPGKIRFQLSSSCIGSALIGFVADDEEIGEENIAPGSYSSSFELDRGSYEVEASSDLHDWSATVRIDPGNTSTLVLPCSPLKYASLIGEYTLGTVAGNSLPAYWSSNGADTTRVTAGSITFDADGTVDMEMTFAETTASGTETSTSTYSSTYDQAGSFVSMAFTGGPTLTAILTNDGLGTTWGSRTVIFTR
jgi:hypothetical protein